MRRQGSFDRLAVLSQAVCRQLPATIALLAFAALVALGGPGASRGGGGLHRLLRERGRAPRYRTDGMARRHAARAGVLEEEVDARRHREEEEP